MADGGGWFFRAPRLARNTKKTKTKIEHVYVPPKQSLFPVTNSDSMGSLLHRHKSLHEMQFQQYGPTCWFYAVLNAITSSDVFRETIRCQLLEYLIKNPDKRIEFDEFILNSNVCPHISSDLLYYEYVLKIFYAMILSNKYENKAYVVEPKTRQKLNKQFKTRPFALMGFFPSNAYAHIFPHMRRPLDQHMSFKIVQKDPIPSGYDVVVYICNKKFKTNIPIDNGDYELDHAVLHSGIHYFTGYRVKDNFMVHDPLGGQESINWTLPNAFHIHCLCYINKRFKAETEICLQNIKNKRKHPASLLKIRQNACWLKTPIEILYQSPYFKNKFFNYVHTHSASSISSCPPTINDVNIDKLQALFKKRVQYGDNYKLTMHHADINYHINHILLMLNLKVITINKSHWANIDVRSKNFNYDIILVVPDEGDTFQLHENEYMSNRVGKFRLDHSVVVTKNGDWMIGKASSSDLYLYDPKTNQHHEYFWQMPNPTVSPSKGHLHGLRFSYICYVR